MKRILYMYLCVSLYCPRFSRNFFYSPFLSVALVIYLFGHFSHLYIWDWRKNVSVVAFSCGPRTSGFFLERLASFRKILLKLQAVVSHFVAKTPGLDPCLLNDLLQSESDVPLVMSCSGLLQSKLWWEQVSRSGSLDLQRNSFTFFLMNIPKDFTGSTNACWRGFFELWSKPAGTASVLAGVGLAKKLLHHLCTGAIMISGSHLSTHQPSLQFSLRWNRGSFLSVPRRDPCTSQFSQM